MPDCKNTPAHYLQRYPVQLQWHQHKTKDGKRHHEKSYYRLSEDISYQAEWRCIVEVISCKNPARQSGDERSSRRRCDRLQDFSSEAISGLPTFFRANLPDRVALAPPSITGNQRSRSRKRHLKTRSQYLMRRNCNHSDGRNRQITHADGRSVYQQSSEHDCNHHVASLCSDIRT